LTDGLGNDSSLSLSTGAASIAGTLAVSSTSAFGGNVAINGSASSLDINPTTGQPNITLRSGNTFRGYIEGNASGGLSFGSGASAAIGMTLTSAGNVGIGTSTPDQRLTIQATGGANGLVSFKSALGTTTSFLGVPNANGDIISTSTTADLCLRNETGSILFQLVGSERARFTTNGLTFNGDTAAANALDDYEEGTWTMGLAFGGASTGITYRAESAATYTKIGRQVTITGFIELTSKGSATGDVTITGMPFAANGPSWGFFGNAACRLTDITFTGQYAIRNSSSTSIMYIQQTTEAGVSSILQNTNFSNNSGVMLTLTYFTA
jgi:hypothetical protein